MIDTIKIRLHGILDVKDDALSVIQNEQGITNLLVPSHQDLYKAILKHKGKNFTMKMVYNKETQTLEQIDEDEFLLLENSQKITQYYQNRNIMRFVDSKQTVDKKMRISGNYRIKSSTPDINYTINESGSYIDFEFSIPKYLFGHNLALFIPQPNSMTYATEQFNLHQWNNQIKIIYKRLMKFIDKFFTDLMHFFELDTYPDLNYVEIRRIDLCYNQFFENKHDALIYLENQKKLKKEKNYTTKKQSQNFGTTYALNTSFGSYFKIYHKGSEYSKSDGDLKKHMEANKEYLNKLSYSLSQSAFEKNDVKIAELLKNNKDLLVNIFEQYAKGDPILLDDEKKRELSKLSKYIKKNMPYDVVFLKNEMDKVLRYEVSLYGDFFKYLYKTKFFRKTDKIHQYYYQIYKNIKSSLKSIDPKKPRLTKEDLRDYKMFHAYFGRSISLLLSKSKDLRKFEIISNRDYDKINVIYKISNYGFTKTLLANKDVGTFSEDFLKMCFKHFIELIEKHQIKKLTLFDDLSAKIAQYNKNVDERLKEYNEYNNLLRYDASGNVKYLNGKPILKASQLLSQTQKRDKKLKIVNANILLMLLHQLEQGVSLEEYRRKANINKSTFYRYKKDLEMFGIYENSLQTEKQIEVRTDFRDYYWLTQTLRYQESFYTNENHMRYA